MIESSKVVRFARVVVAGSALCRVVAAVIGLDRRTRERVVVALGGEWSAQQEARESRQFDAVVSHSRLVGALSSTLDAPLAARHETVIKDLLAPVLNLNRVDTIQMWACVIIVAVMTHTILLAILGVTVQFLGWSVRVILIGAGMVVWRNPMPFATAWNDWTGKGQRV